MSEYVPGQRWINDAELMMGLGTVLAVEHRTVSILFHSNGETRTYAKETAPLTRVRFNVGDEITDIHKRPLKVRSVSEVDHLITYTVETRQGELEELQEQDLDTSIQLNQPLERLLSGQIDDNKWFELRYQSWHEQLKNFSSGISGLTGARTRLIPHQLYIASEVASRYAPRVLLADEVGLGKTIEAGLILHQQLNSGRASRVLIIVPEPLIHQWLVEMLRRFNLFFSIYDEERCQAICESTDFKNPFNADQLILCSLSLFADNPQRFQQALAAQWDLLIVDEAHHLAWQPQQVSEEYQQVEQLATVSKGLLLLTATPEQFGKQSHFARLRLLDADKFSDYDSFLAQEKHYQVIADLIEQINADQPLNDTMLHQLTSLIGDIDIQQLQSAQLSEQQKLALTHRLLDCHGTGRVLFRNTRAAIQGFPERRVHLHRLPLVDEYRAAFGKIECASQQLQPEKRIPTKQSWTRIDPRIQWLVDFMNQHSKEKILLICHYADTAIALSKALKERFGIASSVFHEQLSIVERDKRAADFADDETGVQILLCSEIGSEGRNFQFAHQLILFDLPLNPDLLEQRIGRLDRIGQTETIHIQVPVFQDSAQQRLYEWYHRALNAFNNTCPAAAEIFTRYESQLMESLDCNRCNEHDFQGFIQQCKQDCNALNQQMHEGRDRLLEYSSCRRDIAEKLCRKIETFERQSGLKNYMMDLFDCYGVNIEEHRAGSYVISPAEHMIGQFPGLTEDALTITFDRETALIHDDMVFLSWDHPMVLNGMDMLLGNEMGNTSVCSIKAALLGEDYKPGQLLIQMLFIVDIEIPADQQIKLHSQQLQPIPMLICHNEAGEEIRLTLNPDTMQSVDRNIGRQIVQLREKEIKQSLQKASAHLSDIASDCLQTHYATNLLMLKNETERLRALKTVNPQIRDEEIDFFQQQLKAFESALQHPHTYLDGIRLIITT